MAMKKADTGESLEIHTIKQGRVKLRIIGDTPMYQHSMGRKAMEALLAGGGKKTTAEKRDIKHNPEAEFRESAHRIATGPTLLCFPAGGVKAAMATAALRTEGITKTSVQQLVGLPQAFVPIWGTPQLKIDVVRSADMNRTPDMRTRCYLPQWCAEIEIRFGMPTLSREGIVSMLANAGMIIGIGDFRQEKGRGSFGTFSVHGDQIIDPDAQAVWDDLTQHHGREAQIAAMANPECADELTAELMAFLNSERGRRAA